MARLKNWSFRCLVQFLKAYGFELGHIDSSHHFYNGKIKGAKVRVVQAINSKKEKNAQSIKTMKFAIKHSGIPKGYFEEWKKNKKVHKEIIY